MADEETDPPPPPDDQTGPPPPLVEPPPGVQPPFHPPPIGVDTGPPEPAPPPPPAPPAPIGGGSPGPPIAPAQQEPRYDFDAAKFAELLIRKFYPERTDKESGVMRDFFLAHLFDFERVSFSVRVGRGLPPDPTHLPAVQRNTAFLTRKRIDILAWQGSRPVIIEVKQRVTPAALGQVQTYRHLFLEEYPDALDPRLVVIGRESDDDTLRALSAAGVDVYLYPPADASGDGQ